MSDYRLRELEQHLQADPTNYAIFQDYLQVLERLGNRLTPLEQKWESGIDQSLTNDLRTWRRFVLNHWNLYAYLTDHGWNFVERLSLLNTSGSVFPDVSKVENFGRHIRKLQVKYGIRDKKGILNLHRTLDQAAHLGGSFVTLEPPQALDDFQNLKVFRTDDGYILQWTLFHHNLFRHRMNNLLVPSRCERASKRGSEDLFCHKDGIHATDVCDSCVKKQLKEKPRLVKDALYDAIADYQVNIWHCPFYI